MGENEQRTSWILQDGTRELLGYKYEPSFQKKEEGPQKQLKDLQGCHSLAIGPECTGQGPGGKWEGQGCLHLFQRPAPLPPKESHILGTSPPALSPDPRVLPLLLIALGMALPPQGAWKVKH